MRARAHVSLGVLAASVLVLGACGSDSGDDANAPAPTVTVTETRTATPSASATTSPSASASATKPAGTQCRAGALSAKVLEEQSGAGQRYATLVLTNTSKKSCTLLGYPGLQLVGAGGADVPTNVTRKKKPAPTTVTLAAGKSASSALAFSVVATGDEPVDGACQPAARSIRVIPPDTTTALTAPWSLGSVCDGGRIKANAFVASAS